MARKPHTAVAARATHVAVDPAVFEGLDLGAIKTRATALRRVDEQFGSSVMHAVAAGVPLERARQLGSTYRPNCDH